MRVLGSGLLLVVLLIPTAGQAGDHEADVFVAGSGAYIKGSSWLGGWHVSGAVTQKNHKEWSFVLDLSAHFFGSDEGKDLTQLTLMVGSRRTWGGQTPAQPFVHLMLMGAVYRSEGLTQVSNAAGALALGGGFEWVPGNKQDKKGLLFAPGSSGYRFQADYIRPVATDLKWTVRFSVGWVYRFHRPHK